MPPLNDTMFCAVISSRPPPCLQRQKTAVFRKTDAETRLFATSCCQSDREMLEIRITRCHTHPYTRFPRRKNGNRAEIRRNHGNPGLSPEQTSARPVQNVTVTACTGAKCHSNPLKTAGQRPYTRNGPANERVSITARGTRGADAYPHLSPGRPASACIATGGWLQVANPPGRG